MQHYSKITRECLSAAFPDYRIISRGFEQNWPAYSPDLSPMDLFVWSTLKSRVYFNFVPQNLAEMQNKITKAIKDIDQDELK